MKDKLNLPEAVRARLSTADLSEAGLTVVRRGVLLEQRLVAGRLEFRASGEDEPPSFGIMGYASVTDTPYPVMGGKDSAYGFDETIVSGAFAKALQENDDVRLLVNHDSTSAMGVPLARTKSGTLGLDEDQIGLRYDAPSLDLGSPVVLALRSAMVRKDVDGSSFAFQATRQEWNEDYTERFITEVRLFDVSAVVYPANPAAPSSPRDAQPAADRRAGVSITLAAAQATALRLRRIPA